MSRTSLVTRHLDFVQKGRKLTDLKTVIDKTSYNIYSVYQNHLSSLTICYVSVNFLPYQAIRTVETSDFLINLIFQGRSSDHFESVQSVVSAASSKIEERYSSGLYHLL